MTTRYYTLDYRYRQHLGRLTRSQSDRDALRRLTHFGGSAADMRLAARLLHSSEPELAAEVLRMLPEPERTAP